MNPNQIYSWEMETVDGQILKQYEPDGKENTWKSLDPEKIVRVTFTPVISILPEHTVSINHAAGEKFIKRFARGFQKDKGQGFHLAEYINCVVTNRYRVWVFSTGRVIITDPNYELYI
jgi:hypothetical protein